MEKKEQEHIILLFNWVCCCKVSLNNFNGSQKVFLFYAAWRVLKVSRNLIFAIHPTNESVQKVYITLCNQCKSSQRISHLQLSPFESHVRKKKPPREPSQVNRCLALLLLLLLSLSTLLLPTSIRTSQSEPPAPHIVQNSPPPSPKPAGEKQRQKQVKFLRTCCVLVADVRAPAGGNRRSLCVNVSVC